MNIGVIGDTHRNTDYLLRAVEWLVQRRRITALYHLGDDYDDVEHLADFQLEITQVPGLYDPRYLDGSLPAKLRENVLGLQVLIVHAIEKDVDRDDRNSSDIIIHGHTHKAELLLEDGHLFMNPGHLKGEKDKNMSPTFGYLEITNKAVIASVFDLKFAVQQTLTMVRSESGLYKT